MKKKFIASICLLVALSGFVSHDEPSHFIQTESTAQLYELFHWSPERVPMISAHRGGPAPGYPENCLATFEHTLSQTYAAIEFDVQLSKDDSLVVMHDDKLDRTSNGTGYVRDHTYQELLELRLEDNQGNLTPYRMPTLSEVLHWAKGKTILTLDSKREVPPARIVQAIRDAGAEAYTVVITYTADKAALFHQLHPQLMLSVNVKQPADLERLEQLGVPANRMLAFVGITEPDTALCRQLHDKGIYAILGTMGNLDQKAAARGNSVYQHLVRSGADILSTDNPVAVARAFRTLVPEHSHKQKFFRTLPHSADK